MEGMSLTDPFMARRDPDLPGVVQVLAGGDRTSGAAMFAESVFAPRTAGPGLHLHEREDEAVYVAQGVLTFEVGERRFEAAAGDLVWMPRELPHRFANLADAPARALAVALPAGLEGMFAEQASYVSALDGPPDPARIRDIAAAYGVRALGPPMDAG